jgi:hypothetical protein
MFGCAGLISGNHSAVYQAAVEASLPWHPSSAEEAVMPLAFRYPSVTVPSGTGRRTIEGSATFSSNVRSAGVALNGFKLDYANSDHHINIVEADADIIGTTGNTVRFQVECHYADVNFDDPYEGYVTVMVVADVE